MEKCSVCGTEFDGEFCPQCGKRVAKEKYCPQCGAIHSEDVKFCTKCGYAFVSAPKESDTISHGAARMLTIVRILPAAFMLLFAGLLFLLYSAPVVKDEFLFGAINLRENIYGLMRTEKYGAVAIFVYFAILFAVFSLLYLIFACLPSRWQKIGKKLYLLDFISYMGGVFYLLALVLVSVLFAKIGEQRVVGEASCQLLLLIFTLVFMVIHAGCIASWFIVSGKYVQPTLSEDSWYERKKKACISIIAIVLALTIAGLTVWAFIPKMKKSSEVGTYYLVKNGEVQEDTYIILEEEQHWVDSLGLNGTYTLDENGNIEMAVISIKDQPIGYSGTLKGDTLTLKYTAAGFEAWERTYVKGEDIEDKESQSEELPPEEVWTEYGTYYLIEDGVANPDKYVILKEGNTWEDNGLLGGKYTLDKDGNIEMTAISVDGISIGYTGTVSGDTLKIKYAVAGFAVWERTYMRNVTFEDSTSNNQDLI